MSRSTQYIGLNKKALDYIERNKLVPLEHMDCVQGMFDEDIPLKSYTHPDKGIVREVVQCTCWSCGMMIFTCLAWDFENTYDDSNKLIVDNSTTMFEWVHNPEIAGEEYNFETGEIWI